MIFAVEKVKTKAAKVNSRRTTRESFIANEYIYIYTYMYYIYKFIYLLGAALLGVGPYDHIYRRHICHEWSLKSIVSRQ